MQTYLVRLVSEEVDVGESLLLDMLECVRLVPSLREDVEGNLAADGVCEAIVWELVLQGGNEFGANFMLLVVLLEIDTFLNAGVSSNRRDVDHSISEFDECAPHDGNFQLADVTQAELG